MRRPDPRLLKLLVAAVLCLLLSGTATAAPAGQTTTDPGLGASVVARIDAFRSENGLRPLRVSAQLTGSARQHAVSMGRLGYFSHSSPGGGSAARRITSFYKVGGSKGWAVGEVQAWSMDSLGVNRALALWLASPPHRTELVSTRWREIGVGAVHVAHAGGLYGGRDVTIIVVDFGARS